MSAHRRHVTHAASTSQNGDAPPPSPSSSSLAVQPISLVLKRASQSTHDASDAFVRARMPQAFADPSIYLALLEQFKHIFLAMSTRMNDVLVADDSELSQVYTRMRRDDAFEQDVAFFKRDILPGKLALAQPTDATREYVEHIARLDRARLLVVAYTMHMALLAGGQTIKRTMQRAMALRDGDGGGALFAFEGMSRADVTAAKKVLTTSLDNLPRRDLDKYVAEKRAVFRRNEAVIASVVKDTSLLRALYLAVLGLMRIAAGSQALRWALTIFKGIAFVKIFAHVARTYKYLE